MHTRIVIPRKLERLGVPVPRQLAAVFDLDASLDEIRNSKPVDSLSADLLAGKLDTPTKLRAAIDKTATALAAHSFATEILNNLDRTLEQRARIALRESADELIVAMRPRFEQAVAAFMSGLDALGPDPSPQLGRQSPLLDRHYRAWKSALDDTHSVRDVLIDIDPNLDRLAWYVDGADNLEAARSASKKADVWELIKAGVGIRLNTHTEAQAILEAIRQAALTQADNAAAERARQREQGKADTLREFGLEDAATR